MGAIFYENMLKKASFGTNHSSTALNTYHQEMLTTEALDTANTDADYAGHIIIREACLIAPISSAPLVPSSAPVLTVTLALLICFWYSTLTLPITLSQHGPLLALAHMLLAPYASDFQGLSLMLE
ncbi:hypothetical protein V496_03312 [Pseudogymnoascus sp. VKM F-4515 (FW-2607)]|nr:hypothetical protein V496_03312 [Pseudogymnoascus sp. VKM F-4515 (FW-2607)]